MKLTKFELPHLWSVCDMLGKVVAVIDKNAWHKVRGQ